MTHGLRLRRLAAALTLGTVAIGLAAIATVPARAQSHSHASTSPATPSPKQGPKWATDAPLRKGMSSIRTIVEPQLALSHAGELNAAQYAALAGRIESEVGGIVANCKLEPKADAALHAVIGEIGAGTDAMAGKSAGQRPAQGLVQVAKAVNDYADRFEHPAFKPIRNIH